MASICNEGGSEKPKVNPTAASCGCGDTEAVQPKDNNSLRGAAIALCMSVDELRELLNSTPKKVEEKSKEDCDKLTQLRAEVAFLKSENLALRQEVNSMDIALRRYKNAFVIKF